MKFILKHYFIDTVCLYFASQIASGLEFSKGAETILLTGVGLTVFLVLVKPVINILLLPLNLITFGLFRWLSSGIALFLVTLVIEDFKINGFSFSGISSPWFDIPQMNFGGVLAFIAFSFLISLLISIVHWIVK